MAYCLLSHLFVFLYKILKMLVCHLDCLTPDLLKYRRQLTLRANSGKICISVIFRLKIWLVCAQLDNWIVDYCENMVALLHL